MAAKTGRSQSGRCNHIAWPALHSSRMNGRSVTNGAPRSLRRTWA